MELHKSLLIRVSKVILWALVTHANLGYVQNSRTALPETWLLSEPVQCLSLPVPMSSHSQRASTSSTRTLGEGTKPPSFHWVDPFIPGANQLDRLWEEAGPLPL